MTIGPGIHVLLTGARGGLGTHMTLALARSGATLTLVAHPGLDLDDVRVQAQQLGAKAVALKFNLAESERLPELVAEAQAQHGPVDVLINNAGVEHTAALHELTEDTLRDILNINLAAPMFLTRLVLPGMLQRGGGHIVNISSLAGKAGPAFQEPYAATKAALVAFTASLRATYRGTGVSASVVTPGFVEAGIYTNLKSRSGCSAPRLLGTSRPEAVARAVLAVVARDQFEAIINPTPVRPLLAFSMLFPTLGEWLTERTGGNHFFRTVAGRLRQAEAGSIKGPA